MSDDLRSKVLLTPEQLHKLLQDGRDMTILAIHSINPYTGKPSIRDVRIPGSD